MWGLKCNTECSHCAADWIPTLIKKVCVCVSITFCSVAMCVFFSQRIALKDRNENPAPVGASVCPCSPTTWLSPDHTLNIYMTFWHKAGVRRVGVCVCVTLPWAVWHTVRHNWTAHCALLWIRTLGCLPSAAWHQNTSYRLCHDMPTGMWSLSQWRYFLHSHTNSDCDLRPALTS